jgi:hypothetical protein
MRTRIVLMLGAVALLASLAVACGDGGDGETPGGTGAISPGGGMIAPNQFLTYEGERYELVNMLLEIMVPPEQFVPVGVATESDVDLKGDMRVFQREGDSTAIYTYSAPTEDDGGIWLAWRIAGAS